MGNALHTGNIIGEAMRPQTLTDNGLFRNNRACSELHRMAVRSSKLPAP
jgi:hypothetical protein